MAREDDSPVGTLTLSIKLNIPKLARKDIPLSASSFDALNYPFQEYTMEVLTVTCTQGQGGEIAAKWKKFNLDGKATWTGPVEL